MAKKKKAKKTTRKVTKSVIKKAATKKTVKKKAKKITKKRATKKTANKKTQKSKQTTRATKKATTKNSTGVGVKKKANQSKGASVGGSSVKVGQRVPDFELPGTSGRSYRLSDFAGQKLVLYFYPKDSTPGCTIEGQDFSRLHNEFKNRNAEVIGVSRDTVKSHESFKSKQNYSVELISDSEEKLCQMFGVIKMKNMYGRQVRGIERSTFLIDENGHLAMEWRGVKVPGHAEEVLQALAE